MTDDFDFEKEFPPFPETKGKKFTRFTPDARKVIVYSQIIARAQGFGFIDVADIRAAAERVIDGREPPVVGYDGGGGDIPFTAEAKATLAQTLRICLDAKAPEITPEHLLEATTA